MKAVKARSFYRKLCRAAMRNKQTNIFYKLFMRAMGIFGFSGLDIVPVISAAEIFVLPDQFALLFPKTFVI